jgi:hypothetical protein
MTLKKTHVLTTSVLVIAVVVALFFTLLTSTTTKAVLNVQCDPKTNVVDKRQGETFTVQVTFKNTGDTNGTWSVNVSFEGESNWRWKGTLQTLALKPSKTATLTWTGNVPAEAEVGSTARLIVYFDDDFVPQNWWIHVLAGARLTITNSEVS